MTLATDTTDGVYCNCIHSVLIMYVRLLLLSAAMLISITPASGQKATLVSATEQCWSGGIAGRRGCNYTFTVAIAGKTTLLQPDTLWIGTTPTALTTTQANGQAANTKVTALKNKAQLEIRAATSSNDYPDRYPDMPGADTTIPKPKPPIKYSGVALLSYKYAGIISPTSPR